MNNTNLLIVGGGGSIGNHLINSLNFDNVYILDKQILKNTQKNITFFKCDLLNSDLLEKIISDLPNNLIVLYLAGNLSTEFKTDQIQNSVNDNVIALSNFFNIVKSKLNHFIFVSSISVYGRSLYNPIDENHPIQPFSLYGFSKATAELLCTILCKNQVPLTILRLTQLYGLKSAQNSFPHVLLDALKSRDFSKIKINNTTERDYLHISDFTKFIQKLIFQPEQGIFNIGFGKSVNLFKLIQHMISLHKITFDEKKIVTNEPSFSLTMNITNAKKIFGFTPTKQLDEWINEELKS